MPRKDIYRLLTVVIAIVVFVLVNRLFKPDAPGDSSASASLSGNAGALVPNDTATPPAASAGADSANQEIYKNTQYGFTFTLPQTWLGYTILEDKWEGLSTGGDTGQTVTETGPLITIRHPLWTEQKPRQDIPVMVFTLDQWEALQREEFHIGAAPVGPSELGRNGKFVFALPARYDYAFPEGFEEVENIMKGNPLKPVEPGGN